MKTDNGLAIAFFAVVMGGAVALAIVNDITAPICKAAVEAAPKDRFDFGCLEFWFNRYQSLVGNLLTAGVAGATLLWIARQLVPANQQASIAAAAALRVVVDEWSKHGRDLIEIDNTLRDSGYQSEESSLEDWADVLRLSKKYSNSIVDYRQANAKFRVIATENRAPAIQDAAEQAAQHYRHFAEAANKLSTLSGAIEYATDLEGHFNEALLLSLDCETEQQAFLDAVIRARKHLAREIERAWKRIRELEHSAIGPWWRER